MTEKRPRVIVYETPGVKILEFKKSPGGKPEKVIKHDGPQGWGGDPKKLRKEADKQ